LPWARWVTRAATLQALVDGARHALPVATACALVGVIIGVINLTGVAAEIGGHVIAIGRDNLLLALVLTMLTCLVLGMGIPTIPNDIITSSLAAPVLLELGVPLIVSHILHALPGCALPPTDRVVAADAAARGHGTFARLPGDGCVAHAGTGNKNV